MSLGMVSSRDSSELVDDSNYNNNNNNTIIVKQEYDEEYDYVAVNGPFLCIKTEVDKEDDHDGLVSNDKVGTTRVFAVRRIDDDAFPMAPGTGGLANEELLAIWQQQQGRDSSSGDKNINNSNRESSWMRKDPQCEVWSCKMSANYGHSTGPSRCAQHREAWMVLFVHCMVAGCLKFGVVFSSEDEHVRCEAHAAAAEDRCRRSIQWPQLEHFVGDDSVCPAGLGLGLGLGDDCRVHEGSTVARQQPQVVVIDTSLGLTEESSDHSGNAEETIWAVPASYKSNPAVELNNGATSNSVGDEIHRLKEEYKDLRQKMVTIEIELARLQALQSCEAEKNYAPVKKTPPARPSQVPATKAAPKAAVTNGGTKGASTPERKVSLDGYNWRKYGEISLPVMGGLPHPRNFYGCTNIGCIARKIEERTNEGHVKHFYEGVHNHPQPGKNLPRAVLVPHWKRRKKHHNSRAV